MKVEKTGSMLPRGNSPSIPDKQPRILGLAPFFLAEWGGFYHPGFAAASNSKPQAVCPGRCLAYFRTIEESEC
jgi:hypothetical protein